MDRISAKRFVFLMLMVSIGFFAHSVRADMGRVISVDATVSEDGQKAIILHNGAEEVLILGTDMKSDKKAGFIRFIPFPSEPKVTFAPEHAFDAASDLIKSHGLKFMITGTKGGAQSSEPVSLVFHQKLGAHDITVIRVNDVAGFTEWVNGFFKKKNLPQKDSYPEVETVVQDYVKRGIVYFSFDYVELEGAARSIDPVMYRFKNKELYYPLVTSNTFGGTGRIDLIVVCPRTIGTVYEQPFKGFPYAEASTSSKVGTGEIALIFPDAGEFFKGQERLYLQMIIYHGAYKFDTDFTADIALGADQEITYEELDPFAELKNIAPAIQQRVSEPMPAIGQEYEKFTCYNNYFTTELPKGWRQEEDITDSDATKEYGVTLLGPKSPEGLVPLIVLSYFGADHPLFKSARAFIERNAVVAPDSGGKVTKVREITVAGRKASTFDKETLGRVPPGAVEGEDVISFERVIVVTAKEGFYVLSYTAPESVSDNYLPIFEKTVESFKPNK